MTRQEFEALLDAGQLEIKMSTKKGWCCRRNGKTKTWTRDSSRWEIPIKFGFRGTDRITQTEEERLGEYFRRAP